MDKDYNGKVDPMEFRDAIKKLKLGFNQNEID